MIGDYIYPLKASDYNLIFILQAKAMVGSKTTAKIMYTWNQSKQ